MANLRHPTWRMESSTSSPTGIRRLRSDVRHRHRPRHPRHTAHACGWRRRQRPLPAGPAVFFEPRPGRDAVIPERGRGCLGTS